MASAVLAYCIPAAAPGEGSRLSCSTRYACDGSVGVDFFLGMSVAFRDRQRARSASVPPYRSGQPSSGVFG